MQLDSRYPVFTLQLGGFHMIDIFKSGVLLYMYAYTDSYEIKQSCGRLNCVSSHNPSTRPIMHENMLIWISYIWDAF